MFSNIGRKIQLTAKVLCWIGIVCSVVGGMAMLGYGITELEWGIVYALPTIIGGVAAALLGSLASWVGSFMMIGFGILVERAEEIAANTRKSVY